MYDTLIHSALVLTLEPLSDPIPRGYVTIKGGKVAEHDLGHGTRRIGVVEGGGTAVEREDAAAFAHDDRQRVAEIHAPGELAAQLAE